MQLPNFPISSFDLRFFFLTKKHINKEKQCFSLHGGETHMKNNSSGQMNPGSNHVKEGRSLQEAGWREGEFIEEAVTTLPVLLADQFNGHELGQTL